MAKYTEIFKSVRFQQMLVIALLQALTLFGVISSEQGVGLIDIISTLLGASVVTNTIDKNVGQAKVEALKAEHALWSAPVPAKKKK